MVNLPYTYEFINEHEGAVQPSFLHVHNTGLARFFKRYLMQECLSVYKWTLPDDWDADYFRYILFGWGYLAVFKTDKFGVIPQQCTLGGYNVFYRPTYAMITNPLINSRRAAIGRECQIIKLMPDYGGVADLVDYYGDLMALTYETIATNTLNSKLSYVFSADGKAEADTYNALYDKIASGQPAVVYRKTARAAKLDKEPWQTFEQNVGGNFIADRLLETLKSIRDDFLTHIGVPNLSSRKRERLTVDESQKNDFATKCKAELWLDEMRECIRRVVDMFPELEGQLAVDFAEGVEEDATEIEPARAV